MRAVIRHFGELEVYRVAFELALKIFDMSKGFPKEEKYSLTDQIRRSSRSVCANIAEAWKKRIYPAAFVSKLSDSEAECAETEVWLSFSERHGYINKDACNKMIDECRHVGAMLINMSRNSEQWVVTTRARERERT